MEERLSQLKQELGGELVLTTVKFTEPVKPSEYVFWLFNRWQVGGEWHTGLMVLLALEERRIECEVGYGWERFVSDLESGEVLDEYVLPLLKDGKFSEALQESAERLARRIGMSKLAEEGGRERPGLEGGEV